VKYTTQVEIGLPRKEVIRLFDSSENMFKWQEGLKSFDHLDGEPGQEGARSKMVYKGRKGDLEMTETITRRALPDEFHAIYTAKGVHNKMYNYFEETASGTTTWRTVSEFKFRGLMALMAPFMKSAFTSNTRLSMERFKNFAEENAK